MANCAKIYLGVDWGIRRIGLAIGDSETRLATPLATVSDLDGLLALAEKEGVNELVVGRPVKKGGLDHSLYPAYTEFLNKLKKRSNLVVHEVDERMTSRAADKLGAGGKGAASRDEVAAMLILQSFFDTKT